jgi:hypothetical protein
LKRYWYDLSLPLRITATVTRSVSRVVAMACLPAAGLARNGPVQASEMRDWRDS